MTPSRIGFIAVMFPGVRPSISRASSPTATMRGRGEPSSWARATTDGSVRTMPLPRTYTMMLAVPRSMPICLVNIWTKSRTSPECARCGRAPWSGGARRFRCRADRGTDDVGLRKQPHADEVEDIRGDVDRVWRIGVSEQSPQDRAETGVLGQPCPRAPQKRAFDRRERAGLRELVGRMRHQAGAEQHEDDGRQAEERAEVDASTERVDEEADPGRDRETDDCAEDLALAGRREDEER